MDFTNLTQSNITTHLTIASATSLPISLITAVSSTATGNNFNINTSSVSSSSNSSHNTTAYNSTQRQSSRHNAFEVPIWLILCYSVILLCAIVGNLLVISTLVQNRRMRTITNVFLLNLAISDILLGVLCMPVTLVGTLLRNFIFGEFFCKLIQFSQAASVAVSSWTLVAISCERYYAICHPLRSRRWQTRSHAYKIIACIWCGSMLCMLPIAMFSQLMPTSRQGFRKCRENWPNYVKPYERSYNLFLDLILLVLPLIILSVAYILITRTLYVGMRIEKAMIFGGRQDVMNSPFQKKTNCVAGGNLASFMSTSSLSTSASSSSRLKLNLSLRCHGIGGSGSGICGTTPSTYNNISTSAITNNQGNLENNIKETDIFSQQQQQQHQQQYNHHNHQLPAQRLHHQQHNFQNYHQQHHQILLHDEGQREHHHHQHQQPCFETLSRLCCKCSTSSTTSTYSGRPHLYCMRFATLRTTTTANKEPTLTNNFCTTDCCSSSLVVKSTTATTNINSINSSITTAAATATTLSSTSSSTAPLASTSSANVTMYRYQLQQQQQQHLLHNNHQHNHGRCYCMLQPVVPQFNNKTETKRYSKRSLKVTESVLRRNNIAKNLESKKRVVKMLAVLVLEFFICWTPLYVINTVAMYIGSAIYEYIDYTSISVLQLLAYSSSCCNPITYCFMNANFRRAFWDTFKGMQWCGKRFQRKRSMAQSGANLCLAGSIRVNSYTVQTVIDSPRL